MLSVLVGAATAALSKEVVKAIAAKRGVRIAKNVFQDRAELGDFDRGALLLCTLPAPAHHSGVYVGHGKVIELQGNGHIRKVDLDNFTRTGVTIMVASRNKHIFTSENIATRAEKKEGNTRNYNVILDNCHQFTAGCIKGKFENPNNFKLFLDQTIKNRFGEFEWRAVKYTGTYDFNYA